MLYPQTQGQQDARVGTGSGTLSCVLGILQTVEEKH